MSEYLIDLKELKKVVEVAKVPRVTKHPYFPVIHHLYALRMLGIRHVYIAEWLNTKFKTKINNHQLSDLLSRWKKQGLFNEEKARELAIQIQNTNVDEVENQKTISVFKDKSQNNALTFLKELSKKITIEDNKKESAKMFYDTFKERYEIDEIVNLYVKEINDRLSGWE